MIDFNKIKEAVRIRDEFLAENPQLLHLQEKINEALKLAGNNHFERQRVLQEMMLNKWFEIIPAAEKLNGKT